MRGDHRGAVHGVVHLPEVEQELAPGHAQAAGHHVVGPHGPEPGHAVVDDDAEVAFEHVVDRAVQHVGDGLGVALDQPAGEQVAGQHHRLALGGADPLDHQHVLARLQLQQGRFAGRGRLHPVPPLGDPGGHAGGADGVGDPEVHVQAVGHAGMLGDEGARALAAPQEPFQLHRPEGLAQGRPRHLELGGQLRLGGQAGPGGELSPVDPLLELVLDRDRAQPRACPGPPLWPLHSGEEYTSDNSARVKELDSFDSRPYHPGSVK